MEGIVFQDGVKHSYTSARIHEELLRIQHHDFKYLEENKCYTITLRTNYVTDDPDDMTHLTWASGEITKQQSEHDFSIKDGKHMKSFTHVATINLYYQEMKSIWEHVSSTHFSAMKRSIQLDLTPVAMMHNGDSTYVNLTILGSTRGIRKCTIRRMRNTIICGELSVSFPGLKALTALTEKLYQEYPHLLIQAQSRIPETITLHGIWNRTRSMCSSGRGTSDASHLLCYTPLSQVRIKITRSTSKEFILSLPGGKDRDFKLCFNYPGLLEQISKVHSDVGIVDPGMNGVHFIRVQVGPDEFTNIAKDIYLACLYYSKHVVRLKYPTLTEPELDISL